MIARRAEFLSHATKSRLSIPLRIPIEGRMARFLVSLTLVLRSLFQPVAFGVAGAVLDAQGRVLLVRQTYMAGWRLPGGAIGPGEAPETAVRRELREELGLNGGRVRLFGIYSRKLWWLTHVVALYVIEDGTIDFRPNREVSAIRWDALGAPAPGATPATARRLAELAAGAQQGDRW
jgi:ADP-ribose pyrophosphatase YjhB (NUDIX family)